MTDIGSTDESPRPDTTAETPRLIPSCVSPTRGIAFPPRRLLSVGQELSARGAATTVQSICSDDYTPAINGILARVADSLAGRCQ